MYSYNDDGKKIPNNRNVRENYDGDNKLKTWQLVLIAVAVVLLLVAVWYFVLRKKGSSASSPMGFGRQKFGFRFY